MGRLIRARGFHPFSYQRDVIDEIKDARGTGKVVCVLSSRQKGKTMMCANILLYYAINHPKTKNICLSPTLKQAKSIYKTITSALANKGMMVASNGTDLEITLITGSVISFKSAEQGEALRGYTITGIGIIDEAAFISDDVFNLVLPWFDFHKAPMLLVSTPFIRSGFFFKYYNYGLERIHNTVTINWSDEKYIEDIRKVLPLERLLEYKAMLPKNVFKTEYLGEWLDDDGVVFTNFVNCLCNNTIRPDDILYWGIDWSNQSGNDDTVLTAFNQKGEQVYLKYWNNLTTLGQIDTVLGELEPYLKQTKIIQPELNSIGDSYTELLKNGLQSSHKGKVQGFVTSNPSKNEIVANMQVALEGNKIKLMEDEKLKRQFGYFTATFNPKTKNISYAAPEGLHDDIPMATMIAYDAYYKRQTKGVYAVKAF